jgi:hypothetical protein
LLLGAPTLSACALIVGIEDHHVVPSATVDGGQDRSDGRATAACDGGGDPDLAGYWPLDETSGATAHDCSGRAHDGTVISVPSGSAWTEGRLGGGFRSDGTGGCIDLGKHDDFVLEATAFTVAAWVKPATFFASPDLTRYIVGRSNNGGIAGWRLGTAPTSRVSIDFVTAGGAHTVQSSDGRVPNTWVHAVAVFQPGVRAALYLDGTKVDELAPIESMVTDPAASLKIGCRSDAQRFWDGVIDEVRLYKRALSDDEIRKLALR